MASGDEQAVLSHSELLDVHVAALQEQCVCFGWGCSYTEAQGQPAARRWRAQVLVLQLVFGGTAEQALPAQLSFLSVHRGVLLGWGYSTFDEMRGRRILPVV